jgi:hypothetical protein
MMGLRGIISIFHSKKYLVYKMEKQKKIKCAGVYGIFCGKIRSVYVGWSGNVEGIIRTHKMRLKKGMYRDGEKYYAIQQDWDKYGEESFKIYILEETEDKMAVVKWFSKLDKDGMNIRNPFYGVIGHEQASPGASGIPDKGARDGYRAEYVPVIDHLVGIMERGVVDAKTMPKYLNQIEELAKS